MPKIPVVETARPTPQGGRGIVSIRPQAIDYGPAARGVARSVLELRQQADEFDMARAESELLKSHITTLNSLEDDDFGTYEDRYNKAMDEAIENSSTLIKTESLRQRFMQGAEMARTRGQAQVYEKSLKKETDLGRANLLETIDTYRTSALAAGSDNATRVLAIEGMQRAIKGARAKGYIDAEQMIQLQKKATVDYVMSSVEAMDPEDAMKFLDGTQGGVEFLDADQIEALKSKKVAEMRAVNAELDRYQKRVRTEMYRQATDMVEAGGIKSIPPNFWQELTASERNALIKYDKTWRGVDVEVDKDLYYEWMELPDEKFLNIPVERLQNVGDPKLVAKLRDRRAKLLTTDADEKRAAAAAKARRAEIKTSQDKFIREMGFSPTSTKSEEAFAINRYRESVDNYIEQKEKELQRPLNQQELDDAAELQSKKFVVYDGWFTDTKKRRFEVTINDIPFEDVKRIVDSGPYPGEGEEKVLNTPDNYVLDMWMAEQVEKYPNDD